MSSEEGKAQEEALLDMVNENNADTTTNNNASSGNVGQEIIQLESLQPKSSRRARRRSDVKKRRDVQDLYIELEEWRNERWKVVSRWVKYEQSLDIETDMWSKPSVTAMIYQNLAYLKTTLQTGTIIFDSESHTFEDIIDEIIDDTTIRGHISHENQGVLKDIIMSQKRSRSTVSGTIVLKDAPEATSHRNSVLFMSGSTRRKSFWLNKSTEVTEKSGSISEEKRYSVVQFNINDNLEQKRLSKTSRKQSVSAALFGRHNSKLIDIQRLNEVESCLIMVGTVDFLTKSIIAFVRLTNDQAIDHQMEYGVKIRFIILFFGPNKPNVDYGEIGRCVGALMNNQEFYECANNTSNRQDLVSSITSFTNRNLCLVISVGNYNPDVLAPTLEWMRRMMRKKMERISKGKSHLSRDGSSGAGEKGKKGNGAAAKKTSAEKTAHFSSEVGSNEETVGNLPAVNFHFEEKFDPFRKTGTLFGSLKKEIRHRYSKYLSDITDGLNLNCFIAFVFVFTLCFAPALCFGADKTDHTFGVNEMLLATSINGIVFSLFSGQPLMIFGATGPFLVLEEMLYYLCVKLCIEFLALRIWVSIWVLVFTLIMLAKEATHLIHLVTRFTEEIFSFLIACVFLTDALKKILYYFKQNPIYNTQKYCELWNLTSTSTNLSSSSTKYFSSMSPTTSEESSTLGDSNSSILYTSTKLLLDLSTNKGSCYEGSSSSYHKYKPPEPNIALISLILLVGTCTLALLLKKLRLSNFLGSYLRRILSHVGILISIVLMVLVDSFIRNKSNVNTQKLDIPDDLRPTKPRSWFVSPFGHNYADSDQELNYWIPLAAVLPALVIFIVLFFEVELTGIVLSAKPRKLKKGTGYNLDLLIAALMMTFNSFFGLPWMCSDPVRTLAHWESLTIFIASPIPGDKPKLHEVKEQRLTNLFVHIAVGLCLLAKFLLNIIPYPVLFGVFLYFGIVSLSGTQLFDRIQFIFIPFKHCPNLPYAIGIKPSKRNLFTAIQIIGVLVLLAFKSYAVISFLFPVFSLLLVPIRMFLLPKIFTHRELEALDNENESHGDDESALDFYELTHLAI